MTTECVAHCWYAISATRTLWLHQQNYKQHINIGKLHDNRPMVRRVRVTETQTLKRFLFLRQTWKWKAGPSNNCFLWYVIMHFHDYGRKCIHHSSTINLDKRSPPRLCISRCHTLEQRTCRSVADPYDSSHHGQDSWTQKSQPKEEVNSVVKPGSFMSV